ncbi:MAG: DUF481 domain-containing protein [Gemmatimonadales bacterium]
MIRALQLDRQRHRMRRSMILALPLVAAALAATALPLVAQKTDTLVVRNGDVMTGEFEELQRGKVEYDTDAAGTIYVKWTRVLTAKTNKRFEIDLEDGSKYFGGLTQGDKPNEVKIVADRDTLVVATQSIVRMERIKKTFWRRLDGSIDLGVSYTQQSNQTNFNFSSDVTYKKGLDNVQFNLSTSHSRQDGTDNISSFSMLFGYQREFGKRWFYGGLASGEQNSQLDLELRGSGGAVAGRYLVQSNKVDLTVAAGLTYARERFTDQDADNALQGLLLTDFQFFSWGTLDTDLSSQLAIIPVLNQSGRWRIGFDLSLSRELVSNFYLSVGVSEQFDSQPPTVDSEKNDFSVNTSFGWSF